MRFRTLFLFFVLAELLSLVGYFFPIINSLGFLLIALAALILSLKELEYGLCFILAELILGGKGYLFSFNFGTADISLRMGLFVIVMAIWFSKFIFNRRTKNFKSWGLLAAAIIWGLIMGLCRGHEFNNLFFDANGYFFAAMALPFLWLLASDNADGDAKVRIKKSLTTVFFAATTWLAIKTLLLVFLFTHAGNNFIAANLLSFYRWTRDTGVGEITWLDGNFARVFFQSHIFNIAAFFVLLPNLIYRIYTCIDDRQYMCRFFLCALNAAIIIVSLSRSFWVGVISGLIVLGAMIVWKNHGPRWRAAIRYLATLSAVFFLAVLLLFIVARFPLPRPSPIDFGAAAKDRLEYEAAASSRWNLLPPLWQAIKQHPIIGSGFGATVTYISNDPRVREQNPTGLYTTYAFEWGWLDLWLKLGLVGLILYLILLLQIYKKIWLMAIDNNFLRFGLFSALTALIILNFFTPYLNHPLGFGILIILSILPISKQGLDIF